MSDEFVRDWAAEKAFCEWFNRSNPPLCSWGPQHTQVAAAFASEYAKAAINAAINEALGEALNSGDGTYKP